MQNLNDMLFFAEVAGVAFTAASRTLSLPKSRLSGEIGGRRQLGVQLMQRSSRRLAHAGRQAVSAVLHRDARCRASRV